MEPNVYEHCFLFTSGMKLLIDKNRHECALADGIVGLTEISVELVCRLEGVASCK